MQTGARRRTQGKKQDGDTRDEVDNYWPWLSPAAKARLEVRESRVHRAAPDGGAGMDTELEPDSSEVETVPYQRPDKARTRAEGLETPPAVDIESGPDQARQLGSPASWEEEYERMRLDEHMALRVAVGDEELEQVLREEEEWERQQRAHQDRRPDAANDSD